MLTAAGILPLAVMAGLGLYALKRQQDARAERVGLELARSVANAVDAELRSAISILETLATTPTLDQGDLTGFRERARRVLERMPEWAAIALMDGEGIPVVDTRSPEGSRLLPVVMDYESLDYVLRTRTPSVGSLKRHPTKDWLFAVRVPVIRDAAVKYVISALVTPDAIRDLLTRLDVPGDWLISVVDAAGLRVARSKAHQENVAGRLSESVQAVVNQGGAEGSGTAYALEGQRIFAPYSRVRSSGWIAVLGIPTARVDETAYRSLAAYGGGILLSIAIGTIAAFWVARTIIRPIADLRAAAEDLGHKRTPLTPRTAIQEISEVGAALKIAADGLARGEVEREELLRKERQAREAAETADRAKDEFLTVLSHELRTPLNAVYGWARMLQSGQLRDEAMVARAKDAIVRNADIQVQLIDDLLDLSRITTGKIRLETRRVNIPGVLQDALDAVRPAADAKGIQLHPSIDADAGAVIGDPARLQQIVLNLLTNAVKFTPRGGEVHLQAKGVDSAVEIVVSDTGRGIEPDLLPHLFERFRQADSSSTRAHGGLGLGLALVKHLVELHDGLVRAESAGEGRGAAFTVTLPRASGDVVSGAAPPAPSAAVIAESATRVVRLDGLRVLVADDDPEGLALAEAILARAGADVRACGSAADALAVLRQWRPDVFVSDIEMPGEDGYTLIRKVRALSADEGCSTPAIALTGYGRPQDRLRSLAAGFNMHVPKPVDPGELTAIIAGLAGRAEGRQPS